MQIDYYFEIVPTAKIVGIDLAPGMLDILKRKFLNQSLNLILGLYFDVTFGLNVFDAAVSVELLHHFTRKEKIPLYKKLREALKIGGYFILTDYFALSDDEGQLYCAELFELKKIRIF